MPYFSVHCCDLESFYVFCCESCMLYEKDKFVINVDSFSYIEMCIWVKDEKFIFERCQNNLYGMNGMIWYWLYLL